MLNMIFYFVCVFANVLFANERFVSVDEARSHLRNQVQYFCESDIVMQLAGRLYQLELSNMTPGQKEMARESIKSDFWAVRKEGGKDFSPEFEKKAQDVGPKDILETGLAKAMVGWEDALQHAACVADCPSSDQPALEEAYTRLLLVKQDFEKKEQEPEHFALPINVDENGQWEYEEVCKDLRFLFGQNFYTEDAVLLLASFRPLELVLEAHKLIQSQDLTAAQLVEFGANKIQPLNRSICSAYEIWGALECALRDWTLKEEVIRKVEGAFDGEYPWQAEIDAANGLKNKYRAYEVKNNEVPAERCADILRSCVNSVARSCR